MEYICPLESLLLEIRKDILRLLELLQAHKNSKKKKTRDTLGDLRWTQYLELMQKKSLEDLKNIYLGLEK